MCATAPQLFLIVPQERTRRKDVARFADASCQSVAGGVVGDSRVSETVSNGDMDRDERDRSRQCGAAASLIDVPVPASRLRTE